MGKPSVTPTRTPSLSIPETPSLSISSTRTPSITPSLSISSTRTPSITPTTTPSLSISATRTPSITPSLSISSTRTPSITPTTTPSLSISATRTPSVTLSITPTITTTPDNITDNLQSCWSFEESSDTFYDQTGNGNNLTTVTDVLYQQTGKSGYAAGFFINDAVAIGGTGLEYSTVSISAWINCTGTTLDNRPIYVRNNSEGDAGFAIEVGKTTGYVNVMSYNTGPVQTEHINNNIAVNDGNWHHIVVIINSSLSQIHIYVDNGNLKSFSSVTVTLAISANYRIGNYAHYTLSTFYGYIDTVSVWNRALSSGAVNLLWNSGNGVDCTINITPTPTSSLSPSLSISATRTPSLSISSTPSLSISSTRTPSVTPSLSISSTRTPSVTPSLSISSTRTPSVTPSLSISSTRTPSVTPSLSISATRTPSRTPSITASVSPSLSISATRTPSLTPTPSEGAIYSHNVLKYTTIDIPNTTRTKNVAIGIHGVQDWGETAVTDFWNGMDPPVGGYVIYTLTAERTEPSILIAHNDNEAIYFARSFGGTNINTINEAINYINTGTTNTIILNNYIS